MKTLTKEEQIKRMHRLMRMCNDLYLDSVITKRQWLIKTRQLDKQREAQNITWEELEQYEKEGK